MAKLVLQGDKNSPVEGEKVVYDVWKGRIRERKIIQTVRGPKVVEWSAFSKKESLQILAFFEKAVKEL